MTKEQIVNVLTNYAKENELDCQFIEDDEDMFFRSSLEVDRGILQGAELEQLMIVWDDGDVISAVEFPYEFEEEFLPELEAFLDHMQEENELFNYAYMSDEQAVSVAVRYTYGDEKIEDADEEIMDVLFWAPYAEMVRISQSLIGIDEGDSVEKAIAKLEESEEEYLDPSEDKEKFQRVRYCFEHELLPNIFYNDMNNLTKELLENQGYILYSIMYDICEENHFIMPYEANGYKIFNRKVADNVNIIRIIMPEPDSTPLCYQVYLAFDDACSKGTYFTVERGSNSKERFLCSWDTKGGHHNYGTCTKDTGAVEKRIVEVFSDKK